MRAISRTNAHRWLALAIPALLPAAAFAEPLLLQATADPIPSIAAITATPTAINPLVDADLTHGKFLVLPFAPVNPNETSPWLGKSIQESLVSDLTVAAPGRVVSADQPAGTFDAAIAAGKQSGVRFVVAGGFINVDHELRITGQVLDVDTGKPVAGLKATGDPSHLFQMEDGLALQIRSQVLGQHPILLPPTNEQSAENVPPVQQPSAAVSTQAAPADPRIYAQPAATPQYYSSYSVAPTPPVYGTDYSGYTTYPGYYDTGLVSDFSPYYYDTPGYNSYCGYGLSWCSPFGFGFGGCFGNSFCYGNYGYGRGYCGSNSGYYGGFAGRNYGYNGVYSNSRGSLGVGVNLGIRSSAFARGITASPSFTRAASVRSVGTPYRSAAFYSRGSSLGGRTGGFYSGGFHSSFSSHSFSGGSSHGGGGFSHSGGGGHAGGGHR